ncbi:MAG TPA: NAD(P)(+) transhydrogenase (Re/Si-specific) subunit beta [Thermodesulfovibrionales bacterium]|nr:NAD(P)(+) transhydrogenase (Re/Si-specific) subunit beta [Thermodesulfovibrionales bacterium]
MGNLVKATYLVSAIFFILGLKMLSSPATARRGNLLAGLGMILAITVTFFIPNMKHQLLMILIIIVGTVIGWVSAKKVPLTDMPQMVALFNGMGGGAAAVISYLELARGEITSGLKLLAISGGLIGTISFSGSIGAFMKLQRLLKDRPITYPLQQPFHGLLLLLAMVLSYFVFMQSGPFQPGILSILNLLFAVPLLLGLFFTLPIGGADMPVVISLFNALTGLAVGFDGFAIGNQAMMVSGTIVGASGSLLTYLMAKAMNRSIHNVLFGAFGKVREHGVAKEMKPREIEDAAIMIGFARKVIVVPGYGLAVAQAQHKLREFMNILEEKGVEVKFAIHPVAGRMPGHMNVLLAEANIPYDKLHDLEEINSEFPTTDVALVVGANDVVNPAAETDTSSPIYGMPILKAYQAKNVLAVKRGKGKGFAGIENDLFFLDQTYMLFGDAQDVLGKLVQALKKI